MALKSELEKEVKDLEEALKESEQELHEANNSVEYWSVEYNGLLDSYNELKDEQIESNLTIETIDDEFRLEICEKLYKGLKLEELQELEKQFNL